jgi:hypothetical protein
LRLVTDNPELRTAANTAPRSFAAEDVGRFDEWLASVSGLKRPLIDEYIDQTNKSLLLEQRRIFERNEALLERLRTFERDEAKTEDDEMAGPTREEIDAKLETVGAQTDAKIVRLEGKMDLVLSKLDDAREGNRHTQNIIISVGVALALLIIGVVAAAPVIFDLGSKFHETIIKELKRVPESK